jgi:multidrug efflux pump subunit AcrA (membrane-fusion protein)
VREIAQPEADRVRQLQEELNGLQADTTAAVNTLIDATYYLSGEEQARLDEIEDERARLQEEQNAVNEQAREWYEWAQTEGRRLQTELTAAAQAQLDALTGGIPLDDFITQVQVESRNYLEQIATDIGAFMEAIRTTAFWAPNTSTGGGVIGPGGGPGGPGGFSYVPPIAPPQQPGPRPGERDGRSAHFYFAPNATEREIMETIQRNAAAIASRIKREMANA